jgi:transposase-like protein
VHRPHGAQFHKICLVQGLEKSLRRQEIYGVADEGAARDALETFGKTWNGKEPMIYRSWDEHWAGLCEYFKYSPEIRRAIYTTNAWETKFPRSH